MTMTKHATTTVVPTTVDVKTGQKGLNRILAKVKGFSTLIIVGKRGETTRKAEIMAIQRGLNLDHGCFLDVDGKYGDRTKRVAAAHPVKEGMKGELVKAIQASLYCHGFSTKGIDGKYGPATEEAVKSFQKSKNLTVNGIVDEVTYSTLLN